MFLDTFEVNCVIAFELSNACMIIPLHIAGIKFDFIYK